MNLISIIIPTYNRSYCIDNAIESVTIQKEANWELIIVDDGSTDDTESLIKPYLRVYRISYIFHKLQGVSSARNYGVSKAKGDYFIFLDSDDKFLPGLIESLNLIEFYRYDLISWPVIKSGKGIEKIWFPKDLGRIYNNIKVLFLAGSICFSRKCFCEVGGFDTHLNFGENYELGLRISKVARKIKLLNEPYLLNQINNENRTSNSVFNRLYSGIYQYKKHRDKYRKHPSSDSQMAYILGFLFEKKNKKKTAFRFYSYAWKVHPLNYKAFLKIILFKTMKLI